MGRSNVPGMVRRKSSVKKKILFVVNVDWFFVSHRLPIAIAAQKAGYEVHIATAITDQQEFLEANCLRVHKLCLVRGGVGVVNAFKTTVNLVSVIRRVRPDIMHVVTIKPVLLGGLVARWLRVPALVSAVSGLGYVFIATGFKAWLVKKIVSFIYRLALDHDNNAVIFQNPDDCDKLIQVTGLPASKVVIIRGSGVDLNKFVFKPENFGVPVVLFPARLLATKGVFEFVAAARVLRAKGVVARFVLTGMVDTPSPTSVSKIQLDRWVKEEIIENWGYRTNMSQVLPQANVIVLPSYREGMPKVLLEAAACGRAVVTTDVAGCRDAIDPGVTGILVPVRNVESLAHAIGELLKDSKMRQNMGLEGRKLAEREFDVHAVVEKHIDIYNNILV